MPFTQNSERTQNIENESWPSMLAELSRLRDGRPSGSDDSSIANASEDEDSSEHILQDVQRAASAMFLDCHNTGYYINAYTAKDNPVIT